MKYDLDYFIDKFEAIPEERWCTNTYLNGKQSCVLGHCGERDNWSTEESEKLCKITNCITGVNDGLPPYNRYGSNPKQRVITYLKELKCTNSLK